MMELLRHGHHRLHLEVVGDILQLRAELLARLAHNNSSAAIELIEEEIADAVQLIALPPNIGAERLNGRLLDVKGKFGKTRARVHAVSAPLRVQVPEDGYHAGLISCQVACPVRTDARELVVAGALQPVSAGQVKAIGDFLNRGGALVVLSDPAIQTQAATAQSGTQAGPTPPDPLADYLSSAWGLSLEQDVVVDLYNSYNDGQTMQPFWPLNKGYEASPVTQRLQNVSTLFPLARSIKVFGTKSDFPDITYTPLVKTDPRAWGAVDMAALTAGQLQQTAKDVPGPLTLAVLTAASTVAAADDLVAHTATADARLARLLQRIDIYAARTGLDAEVGEREPFRPFQWPAPAPEQLDLAAEGIRSVIWATGFCRRYPWLKVPVLDCHGEIRHRGGVTPFPGLYVLGLDFLRRRKSTFIDGVGRDALELTVHLTEHLRRAA